MNNPTPQPSSAEGSRSLSTRRPHRRRAALAGGAAVLGAGGLYLTGLLTTGDTAPDRTRVRGVDIGGLDQAAAQQKLDKHLGDSRTAPVKVRVGDRTDVIDPNTAGLSFDSRATAARAVNSEIGPFSVIGRLFGAGGGEVEPVTRLDEDKAREALAQLARKHDQKVQEGTVSFAKGKPQVTEARVGRALDTGRALGTLRSAYLAPDSNPVELPTRTTSPKTDKDKTERALREFAQPAMSGPVTLTTGGKRIGIAPSVLGKYLKLQADDSGELRAELDSEGLLKDPNVASPLGNATQKATDATLRLDGDRVVVESDGKPGKEATARTVRDAVLPLLTKKGAQQRTGEVATEKVEPRLTRANVEKLGLKEKVSSFTVDFEAADYRKTNIGRAAKLINGSVVLPDETWSFNRTVGERTKENGFVDGTIIRNGQYTKELGGGVSAVATTVFNAIFFAGVKPVEYGAHSFYIERYPEGREATVAWGSLDLKFKNDSGNALYALASSTDTSVTVTFLGTKKYDEIKAEKGPRTNVKQPGTRPGSGTGCEPQTPLEGFDVNVDRVFRSGGKDVKRETFRTRYEPRDRVECS
ncbi:VanW family protein [Streptomyces gamaensis]|uniref:VanW family protein n=1 Tax=Streptomyces gamaensis TaxID=1763542 RepID=A0ABW0ZB34_9ACTN